MMIFVLIAGCYTPVCLLVLEGAHRWEMLALVWGLALCGVLLKLLWMGGPRWLSVMLYLGMGWLIVVTVPALSRAIGFEGIAWSVAGGLVYSVGALIYVLKRPNPIPGVFGFHELWHMFVIAGSACHFWVMLRYIAPLVLD
jgi:hemolysin III